MIYALIILAAICNAVMDTLAHHYDESWFKDLNPQFWNPTYSWMNKWKIKDERFVEDENGNKVPRFFLSTTVLVFLTDGWHLFQFLFHTCWQLAIAWSFEGWYILLAFIGIKAGFSGLFQLSYSLFENKLFKR